MRSADGRFEYRDQEDRPVAPGTRPEGVHRIAYRCRSGNAGCSVNLRDRGHDVPQRSWQWDGDVDRPTLAPSINCRDGRCWHGFIEAGVYLNTAKAREPQQ
jgi:hypothetical protein